MSNTKIQRLLVTGGLGFIGSNYINYMMKKDEDLFVLNVDRLDYCSDIDNVEFKDSKRYQLVVCDINQTNYMLELMKRYDIDGIVHFAAMSHVDESFTNSIAFTQSNVLGTHSLLEAARVYGKCKRIIVISSDEVIGSLDEHENEVAENCVMNPTSPYSASKAAAECVARSYYHSFKLPIIIVRPNNAVGPRQYPEKLIPKFLQHLLKGEKCPIQGTGLNRRNFIYVDDICSAVDMIMEKGEVFDIYNIGSNYEFSVLEILDYFIKYLKLNKTREEVSEYVPDRAFNDFRYAINCEKLKGLGWCVVTNFDDAMMKTVDYYRAKWNL